MNLINRLIILFVLLSALVSCGDDHNVSKEYTDWKVYGGSKNNIHYSSLDQVNTKNVKDLKIAWVYHTGDADTVTHSEMQCNPIIVNGIMYGTSPQLKLVAVDAVTGQGKWVFNPQDSIQNKHWHEKKININRGVTYWEDGEDKRILYTVGSTVYAVNATTGKLIPSFGTEGGFDLHDQLDRNDVADLYIAPTSPGMIFKDLFIIGGRVNEAQHAAPGHIRAFDVRTGKRKWIFHTIPQPGQFGYNTWEDSAAYKFIGGANNWSGFSLDEERGILFVPTGSASFDFYGGKRKGNTLFANCLLALNAATGKYIWHFQFVHHDVWDRDLPTPPALVTIDKDGRKIDAVAQTTKQGFLFVFERETGKPVFPIEERAVPTDTKLQGEKLSPTQPMPVLPKPYARQSFTEADINNLIPDSSYQYVKQKLATYKSGVLFNPPSKEGTIIFPGFDGGGEWGGPAFDPETGLLYVNANEMPWVLTMVDAKSNPTKQETYEQAGKRIYLGNCQNCHGPERKGAGNFPSLLEVNKKITPIQFDELLLTGRRMMPSFKHLPEEDRKAVAAHVLELKDEYKKHFVQTARPINEYLKLPYWFTGYNKFETKEGYPAVKPPWGTLNAINLNTGEFEWKIPLGEFEALKAKGIPPTGTENYGGPVVTAGGLVFIAATRDGRIRAFDKKNGKLLWEYKLPFPGYATPSIYMVNNKQYLVIACGGGKMKTASGDAYVAFALPDK
jgi:quinoprotein glucose dehydrogenase